MDTFLDFCPSLVFVWHIRVLIFTKQKKPHGAFIFRKRNHALFSFKLSHISTDMGTLIRTLIVL